MFLTTKRPVVSPYRPYDKDLQIITSRHCTLVIQYVLNCSVRISISQIITPIEKAVLNNRSDKREQKYP